jgi:hypothetical protein
MPIGDALQSLRKSGYGAKPSEPESDGEGKSEGSAAPRLIKLTPEEMRYVASQGGGGEVTCEVKGRLEKDGSLRVLSVSAPGGGEEKDMAAQMMGGMPPMMQPQTVASPS